MLFGLLLALLIAGPVRAQMDRIMASVDGRIVTERDLRYRVFEARLRDESLWREPDGILAELLLTEAVDDLLLWQHFWRAELEPEDAEAQARADERWKEWERLAGSPWNLRQRLSEAALGEEEVRVWLQAEAKRDLVTDRAIGARLDQSLLNREASIAAGNRVRLAHILLVPAGADAKAAAEAEQQALQVRLHIEEGFPFSRAAAVYSDDAATRQAGGDLGWLAPAELAAEVADAVRNLSPGQTSRPVRMEDGWHLFHVLNVESPSRAEIGRAVETLKRTALVDLRTEREIKLAEGLKLLPLPALQEIPPQDPAAEARD